MPVFSFGLVAVPFGWRKKSERGMCCVQFIQHLQQKQHIEREKAIFNRAILCVTILIKNSLTFFTSCGAVQTRWLTKFPVGAQISTTLWNIVNKKRKKIEKSFILIFLSWGICVHKLNLVRILAMCVRSIDYIDSLAGVWEWDDTE